jgi:tetratricopeptide (TPR) repeat protein
MTDFLSHESIIHDIQSLPVMMTGKLIGREVGLAQVYTAVKASHPVLVHGRSGVGKTALSATLAAAYLQQDGEVLWMSVDNPRLEELLVRVGRAYGIDEITNNSNPVSMIGAVENTLKTKRPLVVLDGDLQPEVLSRFLSRCADGIPAVIATEQKLEGTWMTVALEKLDADQAAALFKRESRLTTSEHDIDVYGITKLVGHLPIGIIVAARAMLASKQTPDAYFKLLQQIANAAGGNNPIVALTASFRALTGPLQGLLLMMGATFNGKISPELLSMVSGAPQDSVQQAVNILMQLHLVEIVTRYDSPYYQLHPAVHNFAQTWLKNSNRLDSLNEKMRDTVVTYARNYAADWPDNYKKLAVEIDSFMATARWADKQGDTDVASQIVSALTEAGDFVQAAGYLYEQMELRAISSGAATPFPAYEEPEPLPDEDLASEEIEALEEEEAEIEASFISNVQEEDSAAVKVPMAKRADLSTKDLSKLRTSLAQAKQAGDVSQQIDILKAIGDLQIEQNMESQAIATHGELLTIYEEMEDDSGVLETLDMLSSLMVKTENSQAAIMHATRGAKLADELEDDEVKMHVLTTLGDARQQLGESDSSGDDYSEALKIARDTGDSMNEAVILYKLGFAQLDNSEADAAINTWEQALQLFKGQFRRDYEGRTLGGLGSAYGDLGRWEEAVKFHTSALHIARETGNKEEEALQLGNLAYAALQAGQLGEAVLRYRQALHLAYDTENEDNIVSTIVDLAQLLLRSWRHTAIADLLIDDAMVYEPYDRDVTQLKDRVSQQRDQAEARSVEMLPVHGTARDYAANAYRLLEG